MYRSPVKATILLYLYLAYLAAPLLLTYISSPEAPFDLYKLGQMFGALAISTLAMQFVLSSRSKLLERRIGLDKIMRVHRMNGLLLFVSVLLHPTLLYLPLVIAGTSFQKIISTFSLPLWLGSSAATLVILTVLITVFSKQIKLNYEHWRILHKAGYVIAILGFSHSFIVGTDIVTQQPLYYWWLFVLFLVVATIFYRYIIRYFQLKNAWYRLTEIEHETHNVHTFVYEPEAPPIIKFEPGQFAFVTFKSKHVPSEEHIFSISSSPKNNKLFFTIKSSGDYTKRLHHLEIGDKARVDGPYGAFTHKGISEPLVFIAGGIGVTPMLSMLRYMKTEEKPNETLMIYANKKIEDIAYYKELTELAKNAEWFKLVHVVSDEHVDGKGHYNGWIDDRILKNEVNVFEGKTFFTAGPPNMVTHVETQLLKLGAPKSKLVSEKFALN